MFDDTYCCDSGGHAVGRHYRHIDLFWTVTVSVTVAVHLILTLLLSAPTILTLPLMTCTRSSMPTPVLWVGRHKKVLIDLCEPRKPSVRTVLICIVAHKLSANRAQ